MSVKSSLACHPAFATYILPNPLFQYSKHYMSAEGELSTLHPLLYHLLVAGRLTDWWSWCWLQVLFQPPSQTRFLASAVVGMQNPPLDCFIYFTISLCHPAIHFRLGFRTGVSRILLDCCKVVFHQGFHRWFIWFIAQPVSFGNLDTLNSRLGICHGQFCCRTLAVEKET